MIIYDYILINIIYFTFLLINVDIYLLHNYKFNVLILLIDIPNNDIYFYNNTLINITYFTFRTY